MEFITHRCPICNHSEPRRVDHVLGREGREYDVAQCANCGLLFVSPFPKLSQKDYERIYDMAYYDSNWGDQGCGYFNQEKMDLMQMEAEHQRREIEKETGIARGSILDVGCGDGRYLRAFAAAGWRSVGVEVSAEAVEQSEKSEGVEIIQGAVESVNLEDSSFDVVRLKHCIEHLSFPRETLVSVCGLLKPGGFLVLDTDNADGLRSQCERVIRRVSGPVARWGVRRLMGKDLRSRYGRLSPPVHLLYFSPHSLRYAVESAGFYIQKMFSAHHGHPVWFPLAHPYRCHPLEATFRILDRLGAAAGHGEALVCFARKGER